MVECYGEKLLKTHLLANSAMKQVHTSELDQRCLVIVRQAVPGLVQTSLHAL